MNWFETVMSWEIAPVPAVVIFVIILIALYMYMRHKQDL